MKASLVGGYCIKIIAFVVVCKGHFEAVKGEIVKLQMLKNNSKTLHPKSSLRFQTLYDVYG